MRIDRALDSLPIGVFETDVNCRLTNANETFRALALGGGSITQGVAPWSNAQAAERAFAEESWQRARQTATPFTCEFRVTRPDGQIVWVHVSTQPQLDSNSNICGYVGTAHDVTEAVVKRVLSEQLVGLLDVTSDAVLLFDQQGGLMFCNQGARELVGASENDGGAGVAAQMFIQAIRDQVPREVTASSTNNSWEGELGFRGPDGIMRILSIVLQIVRAANGVVSHYSAIARDVTAAKQLQDELTRQATHDAMTGLPNRVLFLRKLSAALERSRTLKRGVTVLFVDLDKLKDVNDNIGHGVGDQLLNSIAQRLVAATRPSDVVARIGGDEFVVLCDGLGDEHVAMDVAERVRHAMTGQVVLQGNEIFTSASIGIAIASPTLLEHESPNDAAVTLLRNADTAMYRAKQRGRGRCEIFSEEMRKSDRERAALSSELERALATNQLFLVHQPIVSALTGRVAGSEALLRWDHPNRGMLTPPAFLELAELNGSIGPIGDWVIRQACVDARGWMDEKLIDMAFVVHVNVSARQLSDSGFVERVTASLREARLEPIHLALEINENTMLSDNPAIMRAINALKRHGVKLAIDDFGTGYSSLAHLRDFPADFLKLDGTLVRDIGSQGPNDPIARSIIQLAHSLDMSVIAEWVTADVQTQRLRMLGCDFVQGNRIGEPVIATEFAQQVQAPIARL